jgi:hypothetical protein
MNPAAMGQQSTRQAVQGSTEMSIESEGVERRHGRFRGNASAVKTRPLTSIPKLSVRILSQFSSEVKVSLVNIRSLFFPHIFFDDRTMSGVSSALC